MEPPRHWRYTMHTAANAYTAAHLADLHDRLANVRAWEPSARRDALIEDYEMQIEEYTERAEIGAECAEVADEMAAEQVEVSAALNVAIVAAQETGCALVKGAPSLMRELVRLVPGCVEVRGALEIATVYTEGGEVRLVRRAGSYRAAMRWRAA